MNSTRHTCDRDISDTRIEYIKQTHKYSHICTLEASSITSMYVYTYIYESERYIGTHLSKHRYAYTRSFFDPADTAPTARQQQPLFGGVGRIGPVRSDELNLRVAQVKHGESELGHRHADVIANNHCFDKRIHLDISELLLSHRTGVFT